jgi:hypothetical protein
MSAASNACSKFETHDSAVAIIKGAVKRSFRLGRRRRSWFDLGIPMVFRKREQDGEEHHGFAGVDGPRELVGNDGTTNDMTTGTSAVSINKSEAGIGIIFSLLGPGPSARPTADRDSTHWLP